HLLVFFFFSSRRRHTRFSRDWSSDVCSSDLTLRIEDLMRELVEDYTIIIVTHNMQQAARVSDLTAFMTLNDQRSGTLAEMGPTDEIFTHPRDPRTEDYITGRVG